jgi:FtsP/CotA-like multicopper oxidase with cupredoxin domain
MPRTTKYLMGLAAALVALGLGTGFVQGRAGPRPRTHTYFVAVDEVAWDYAPSGMNQITGKPFGPLENINMAGGPDRIGHVSIKAVYREYTDASFTTLKPRPAEWEHLGILGPVLRAEVGDTIRVVFRNNGQYPYSMHPHGVFYTKSSEGAQYADGTSPTERGDQVAPGGTHTYVWPVPERAGPASHDASSIVWMYHSHVAEDADLNSGLVGPIIVTARGTSGPDGRPKDVDREFVAGFLEMDENASQYLDENIKKYAGRPEIVKKDPPGAFFYPFNASNLKETINGFTYGNGPVFTMRKGERVRWYLLADANFQVHAPHWHGNTVVVQNMRTDVVSLTTMGMVVADMVPDNPGTWLFHCHVGPHLLAGMVARYAVTDAVTAKGE